MEVGSLHIAPSNDNEEPEYDQLQDHHSRVHRGAFADAQHQDDCNQCDDAEREDVNYDRNAENVRRAFEETRDFCGCSIVRG